MHLTTKTSNTQSKAKRWQIYAELIDKSMALIAEIGLGD